MVLTLSEFCELVIRRVQAANTCTQGLSSCPKKPRVEFECRGAVEALWLEVQSEMQRKYGLDMHRFEIRDRRDV
ncbi:hypothetical protein AWB64_04600 [Caballeronia sordidicola]|uniref:Uncharacterized protein n=1 Tax=Caballeronia sordidicola TaxID=196367 RepID=A0A158HG79_CABSO|nr:hypothetical protein AWB64_04600 [Caballeronia sordidicola]